MQLYHTLIYKVSRIFQKWKKQFCPICDRNHYLKNKHHKKHNQKLVTLFLSGNYFSFSQLANVQNFRNFKENQPVYLEKAT